MDQKLNKPKNPAVRPGNVFLSGHINVPAERIAAIKRALVEHIDLTRAEEGCIYFDVTPDSRVAGRFSVYEIFVDRAAFEHHQARAKSSLWAEVSAGIERHYTVSHVNMDQTTSS